MRFPLTERLLEEAERFNLRSACCHCMHGVPSGVGQRCALEWPNDLQKRWPLSGTEADFCKEFELL